VMLDKETRYAAAVVTLPGQVDLTNAERAYDQLYAAFASGVPVVIADFSATSFCDCSSLRRLLAVQCRAAARGAQLRLAIPPGGPVHRLAQLLNLGRQLQVYPGLREAAEGTLPRRDPPGPPRPAAGRTTAVADIIELLEASQLHILRWQARLGQLRRQRGAPAPGPEVAAAWDTAACLIDLHMQADDEICAPAIYDSTTPGRALARSARDAHDDIREILRETGLQPPGSPLWWDVATTALSAWALQLDYEEHGPPAECRHRADPALRAQLAGQWRAFREAFIRDQYPGAPAQLPTCQLRRARPATPRLADPAFGPLACTCPDCTERLARGLPSAPGIGGCPCNRRILLCLRSQDHLSCQFYIAQRYIVRVSGRPAMRRAVPPHAMAGRNPVTTPPGVPRGRRWPAGRCHTPGAPSALPRPPAAAPRRAADTPAPARRPGG
jgi:anti-anti-sigma factor